MIHFYDDVLRKKLRSGMHFVVELPEVPWERLGNLSWLVREVDGDQLSGATSWQACDHVLGDHGVVVDLPERQWIATTDVLLAAMAEDGPQGLEALS